jgi:hypothetical protein
MTATATATAITINISPSPLTMTPNHLLMAITTITVIPTTATINYFKEIHTTQSFQSSSSNSSLYP